MPAQKRAMEVVEDDLVEHNQSNSHEHKEELEGTYVRGCLFIFSYLSPKIQ
jgi:hypothetical protein